jgi:hypothetical protein
MFCFSTGGGDYVFSQNRSLDCREGYEFVGACIFWNGNKWDIVINETIV